MRREPSSLGILGGPSAIGYSVMDVVTGYASEDFEKSLDAIVRFFNQQNPPNAKARGIKDEFSKWVNGLSWWDKANDKVPILDKAKNYKYDYDVAVNPAYGSPAAVAERAQYGSQFDSSRANEGTIAAKTTSGRIAEAHKPLVSPWTWAIIGVVAAGGLFALSKVTTLAQVFGGKRKPAAAHAANPGRRSRKRR